MRRAPLRAGLAVAALTLTLAGCVAGVSAVRDTDAPDLNQIAEDWADFYAPERTWLNRRDVAVPVLSLPERGAAAIGQVGPGQGGLIQTCARTTDGGAPAYCRIAVDALNAIGWVEMSAFAPAGSN